MYRIQIGKGLYTYLIGNQTVAIISPSRKKLEVTFAVLKEAFAGTPITYIQNGTSDGRIAPEEIVAYVLKYGIK